MIIERRMMGEGAGNGGGTEKKQGQCQQLSSQLCQLKATSKDRSSVSERRPNAAVLATRDRSV